MRRVSVCGVLVLFLGVAVAAQTVVTTHAVLGEFARIVGEEAITVVSIIPSGFCPSHYDLSPSDLAAVMAAGVILYSGIEPWMDTLLDAVGTDAVAVQLPGPWNTPEAAKLRIREIRDVLAEQFPASADGFTIRADAYIEELDALAQLLKSTAESVGAAGIPVVCMQWQVDFVTWMGFEVVASYGIPESLSLRDLVDLTAQGRAAGAQLVIDNLQSGIDFGAKLAREINAVHVVLSNFPGAMPGTATVLDLLDRNAASLFSAIEPIDLGG